MRVKVYCFIPACEAEEVIECGSKLNSRLTKTIELQGGPIQCFEAYLHPRDGISLNPDDVMVKITVPEGRAYVADNSLLGELGELYNKSIIPVNQYKLGKYRDSLFYKTDDLVQSFKDVALNAYYNMKAASGEYTVQFNDEFAAFIDKKSSEVIAIVRTKFNSDKN